MVVLLGYSRPFAGRLAYVHNTYVSLLAHSEFNARRLGAQLFLLTLLVLFSGCREIKPPNQPSPVFGTGAQGQQLTNFATRANALCLLHDLLNDEKNVSKVLLIKHASPEVKELIKRIASDSGSDLKTLESFSKGGAAPDWDNLGLPPGEIATRKAISKTKEHELLHNSGKEFEFQLLLTQAEGLNYGAHLARIAAENETDDRRATQLRDIGQELADLHREVLTFLRKPH